MPANPASPPLPRRDVVLIVDDEQDILDALRDTLEAYLDHTDVLTALSGPEALVILRDHPVDLLITDYKMPGMTGIELLREVDAVAPRLPRIMVTAFPDLQLAIQAVNEGHIANFLTKPLDTQQVVQCVGSVLHEAKAVRLRSQAFASSLDAVRKELERQRRSASPKA